MTETAKNPEFQSRTNEGARSPSIPPGEEHLPQPQQIYVVDDDAAVRESLTVLLEAAGFAVAHYESPLQFLDHADLQKEGCLIADIDMPEMDGLALQQELGRRKAALSVVIITGHADIELVVRAMNGGAVEFLEKPFDEAAIVKAVQRALAAAAGVRSQTAARVSAEERLSQLTAREREVFVQIIGGHANKTIAAELNISQRTVEGHRARLMSKLRVQALPDLVRLAMDAEIEPSPE